jgi:hypothetical protein
MLAQQRQWESDESSLDFLTILLGTQIVLCEALSNNLNIRAEVILYRGVVEHIDNTLISSAQRFKLCLPNRPEMPLIICVCPYMFVYDFNPLSVLVL